MKSTRYLLDISRGHKNRALAYEKEGGQLEAGYAARQRSRRRRGLLSTASDLLIWNDALTSDRLGKFVTEKLQEPATLNNGRKLSYARGLIVDRHTAVRMVWHSGGAAGYKTWSGRFPDHGFSIAIMCNSGEVDGRRMRSPPAS